MRDIRSLAKDCNGVLKRYVDSKYNHFNPYFRTLLVRKNYKKITRLGILVILAKIRIPGNHYSCVLFYFNQLVVHFHLFSSSKK